MGYRYWPLQRHVRKHSLDAARLVAKQQYERWREQSERRLGGPVIGEEPWWM